MDDHSAGKKTIGLQRLIAACASAKLIPCCSKLPVDKRITTAIPGTETSTVRQVTSEMSLHGICLD
jgi:hypothetical protein